MQGAADAAEGDVACAAAGAAAAAEEEEAEGEQVKEEEEVVEPQAAAAAHSQTQEKEEELMHREAGRRTEAEGGREREWEGEVWEERRPSSRWLYWLY